jgi:SAM-dependent methyltransferase
MTDSPASLEDTLRSVAQQYPEALRPGQLLDLPRAAFHIRLIHERTGNNAALCDLGGGIGIFAPGCAAVGMRVTLVDDFADPVNQKYADIPFTLHPRLGVTVVSRDIIESPPDFAPGSLDAVTALEVLEHVHSSPRALLHRAVEWLRPGGLLLLAMPNCVNLRKRITVPLGRGKWTSMADWYGQPRFRSHVREADVDDLRYIARDLGLVGVEILGRNWLGYCSDSRLIRALTRLADVPLRVFPSLCADIYLIGAKPKS